MTDGESFKAVAGGMQDLAAMFATKVPGYLLLDVVKIVKDDFPGLTKLQYQALGLLALALAVGDSDAGFGNRALRTTAAGFALENAVATQEEARSG